MEKYGFVPRYPPAVMDQVGLIQEQKFQKVPDNTEDLRSLLWSSIDNHDSRDLDQLEYCERRADGTILVRVAIADVDSLVHRQTPADEYAGHNGTTIYTGVLTFPMLPEKLSYGITSLLPDRDRLAVIIEFVVRQDGSFVPERVFPALVRNRAKLVYDIIGAWFDGTNPGAGERQFRRGPGTAAPAPERRLRDCCGRTGGRRERLSWTRARRKWSWRTMRYAALSPINTTLPGA